MNNGSSPSFAMVAGETSGDLIASHLLQAMRLRWPALSAMGIGGPHMSRQGFVPWWSSDRLAVRGYVEVLRHYRDIINIRKELKGRLLARAPELFVGIDAPDFNLDLECDLRAAGVKTMHFICPSVWAWRADRVDKIRRAAQHVLCIFPFEPDLLHQQGIEATYVGHPLAQAIPLQPDRSAARKRLGVAAEAPVLAVLPGSRASEVQYIARSFIEAATQLQRLKPGLQVLIPALPHVRPAIESLIAGSSSPFIRVVDGQSHAVLEACDLALVASGTATLEAALYKRPMVIGYRMNALSWQIMRRKRLQPWVGLPNILCRDFVVPELLQSECSPQRLAEEALAWFNAPDKAHALQQRFSALHQELLRDTAQLATDAIQSVLQS